MPSIVFASPKGGVGKSTSAVLLATELAAKGVGVTLIDADPNRPLTRWAKLPGKPDSLTVVSNVTEDTLIPTIDTAAQRMPFVIVDLEGTASQMIPYAMSRADLVIIPTQGSQLDAAEAVKAIRVVKNQELAFRRKIPAAVLFTRTNAAIRPRTLKSIEAEFQRNGLTIFDVQLHERDAFRAIFAFGGTLSDLPTAEVSNIPAAVINARAFMGEVIAVLKRNKAQVEQIAEVA